MFQYKILIGKIKSKIKKLNLKMTELRSEKFCVIPWVHLNIIPRGKVYHCCMTTELDKFVGDLNTQSLEEVWNSDYLKDIRKKMMNGDEPKACSKCFESERSSGVSTRLHHNQFFKSKLKDIPVITKSDGHVDQVDLRYWDFRFSNLCNFRCRTCGPEFSSSWIPEAEKRGYFKDQTKVLEIETVNQNTNVDFLKKYVNNVEKIYFAGGEPLLMDEHWQILDMLVENKRFDVVLTYNTNLSKLIYQNKNALDYWKQWGKKVWLWPSIDEIDERAELIRKGTNWSIVEKNLLEVSKIGIHVKPGITVSCMNVHRIPEILDRLIDIGVINQEQENWLNFSFNMVEYAPRFHVSSLSDNTKTQIKEKLERYIDNFKNRFGVDCRWKFLHLFWHLDKPHNPENKLNFKKDSLVFDEHRNEDTLKIIPEIKELFE